MAGNSSEPGVSVPARLLAVLAAFDADHRALTLTELSRRAELPLPTAHRLVGELTRWGALARRSDGAYEIGRRMWDLGLLAPMNSGLRQLASPFLHDLFAATRATVHLAERDGQKVLYLDRISGHASVPVVSDVGSRLPMHATGVGKVLLAHAPEQIQDVVLRDLRRVTPYTLTQPGRLRAELRRIRRDGYATTSEEMSLGACSVAVPITGPDNEVGAALGLVVADLRGGTRAQLVAALQVAAQGISRSIAQHALAR